jgi:hypothetical protein
MTEHLRPPLLIVADLPQALTDLCGISLLERMRRTALHLGFREATIFVQLQRVRHGAFRQAVVAP